MRVVNLDGNGWTYGAEHELADWDTEIPLPDGFSRSPDYTIVNSNGIAAQPSTKTYRFGGEFNTPPTSSPDGQVNCLMSILRAYPTVQVNHRSNLHVHVRVPGLATNLFLLKRLQRYIHEQLPEVICQMEPIPIGNTAAERKREKRRYVSHQTFLTQGRLDKQLSATTLEEFFRLEVPTDKHSNPMWHAQPRLAVGLRQMLQTDTIEFRHFPGTLDGAEMLTCVEWCRDFLLYGLRWAPLKQLWETYSCRSWPRFPDFDYEMEVGYQATASHNGLSKSKIVATINMILEGRFYGSSEYKEAEERACGLSRKRVQEPTSSSGVGEHY